jgi:hypothetical protein
MSVLAHITDSTRTSRDVKVVPIGDLYPRPELLICEICVDACVDTLATKDHGWRERQIDYLLRLRNRRTAVAGIRCAGIHCSRSGQSARSPSACDIRRCPYDDLRADSAASFRCTGKVARGLHECLDQFGFPRCHGQRETSAEHRAEHKHFECQGTACKLICKSLRCEIHHRSRCIDARSSRGPEYNHPQQTARTTPPPTTPGKPKRRVSRRKYKNF